MAVCGIYGGSFDPPHVGHVLGATYVLSVGWVDRVLIVPVFEHAFHKELTPFEHRVALCQRAFGHLPGVQVLAIERGLSRPSYTLHTVQAIREQFPGDELRLLMGADAFADTPKWHRYEELAELAPPLILGRVGSLRADAPPPVLPGISSTEVRSWLKRREQPEVQRALEASVPRSVREEIELRGLYR